LVPARVIVTVGVGVTVRVTVGLADALGVIVRVGVADALGNAMNPRVCASAVHKPNVANRREPAAMSRNLFAQT
jgi:hypothetical protein